MSDESAARRAESGHCSLALEGREGLINKFKKRGREDKTIIRGQTNMNFIELNQIDKTINGHPLRYRCDGWRNLLAAGPGQRGGVLHEI